MRLINADNLLKIFDERLRVYEGENDTKERYAYMAWLRSWHAIKDAPTIDAVEVVRCKDCDRGFSSPVCPIQSQGWAINKNTFYCAWGERSEE